MLETTGGFAGMVDEASDAAFPLGVQVPVPGAEIAYRGPNVEGWKASRHTNRNIAKI